jgi:hypothetical protein
MRKRVELHPSTYRGRGDPYFFGELRDRGAQLSIPRQDHCALDNVCSWRMLSGQLYLSIARRIVGNMFDCLTLALCEYPDEVSYKHSDISTSFA